jgi:hypothetical protein
MKMRELKRVELYGENYVVCCVIVEEGKLERNKRIFERDFLQHYFHDIFSFP